MAEIYDFVAYKTEKEIEEYYESLDDEIVIIEFIFDEDE